MTITTTTHLNFVDGRAQAALEFWAAVFGGDALIRTYGDFGMPAELPDAAKVVFGQVTADNGFRIMAYDVPGGGAPRTGSTRRQNGTTVTDEAVFVSVSGESLAEIDTFWSGLSDGATVIEPLAASAWSRGFGMLTDRFGVTWVFDVRAA